MDSGCKICKGYEQLIGWGLIMLTLKLSCADYLRCEYLQFKLGFTKHGLWWKCIIRSIFVYSLCIAAREGNQVLATYRMMNRIINGWTNLIQIDTNGRAPKMKSLHCGKKSSLAFHSSRHFLSGMNMPKIYIISASLSIYSLFHFLSLYAYTKIK